MLTFTTSLRNVVSMVHERDQNHHLIAISFDIFELRHAGIANPVAMSNLPPTIDFDIAPPTITLDSGGAFHKLKG